MRELAAGDQHQRVVGGRPFVGRHEARPLAGRKRSVKITASPASSSAWQG